MTLSDKKLYCGDKKNNIIADTVFLYTDLSDVQNQGKTFNFNGQNLYAKYGELTDSKASKIHCRINGVEKALLRTALYTWDVRNMEISSISSKGVSFSDSSINLFSDYDAGFDGEIDFNLYIPKTAKNAKFTCDWYTRNKPNVTAQIFGYVLGLNGSSSQTEGNISVDLRKDFLYLNGITCRSYEGGAYKKYIHFTNMKIELEFEEGKKTILIDNFENIRQLNVKKTYQMDIFNGMCRMYSQQTATSINDGYIHYDLLRIPNASNQIYNCTLSFKIKKSDANTSIRVYTGEDNYERHWAFGTSSDAEVTIPIAPGTPSLRIIGGSYKTTLATTTNFYSYIDDIKISYCKD